MANPDVYWLALRKVHGIGPRIARLLLERFGTPQRVFDASEEELAQAGVYRATARNIKQFDAFEPLEKELCELPRLGARLVKWTDKEYPPNLRHIPDPPTFLYVRGELRPEERNCIAVVGARAASDVGRHMAHRLGMELAAKGLVVVSGLARGIDTEAHQGALDGGGRTIAVMGSGIDVIYPQEHRQLAESIVDKGGALISELSLGTAPIAENFPPRNRILAGLCLGVVIVEAAEKSGSLITARMALEQDRQVFAVPGSPAMGKARGSNRLLKEGAVLVECVEDVLEELAPQLIELPEFASQEFPRSAKQSRETHIDDNNQEVAAPDVKTILNCLKQGERVHVDSIVDQSGIGASGVLRLLLELELKGIVAQHPGKLFSAARMRM
jgi:DNA processing protein